MGSIARIPCHDKRVFGKYLFARFFIDKVFETIGQAFCDIKIADFMQTFSGKAREKRTFCRYKKLSPQFRNFFARNG